jgi:S-DNA-T family DNA segregation ATPase FtsK/SpoIIIE
LDSDNDSSDIEDDLYEDARQTVVQANKASTSFLQRKLGIGYARAARLMDILEEQGVIGPGSGAKPREILMKGESSPSDMPEETESTE